MSSVSQEDEFTEVHRKRKKRKALGSPMLPTLQETRSPEQPPIMPVRPKSSTIPNKIPVILSGFDSQFKSWRTVMVELRQHHPSLKVSQVKELPKGDLLIIGDSMQDMLILQNETKMKAALGKNVRISLPKAYQINKSQNKCFAAIMKLFEWVIEKRLRKHLEDNGFFSKYQSGFRKSKSTNDHLFRLSQTIMESFNRGEHVIAPFLDVEKAFDNVWHNGLRYKIYQLDLPTKLCRWLSDFPVGRVIQVKIEGFLSPKVYPKAGVPQGSNLSPLLFLIYVNDMPNPSHHQTDKSQFAYDAGQWAVSKNIDLAVEYLQRDLDKLARWCAKWRIKLNPEKTKVIIFSKSRFAIRAEPALSL